MPELVIIGGPNGAGKSTVASIILPEYYDNNNFVNADVIAKGLSGFNPASADFEAGRIMVNRLRELKDSGQNFSFESTLSSRSLLNFVQECRNEGYNLNIIFIWLKTPEIANERVYNRKSSGGHFIPAEVVIRRYKRSKHNFVNIYLPPADEWKMFDNSEKQLKLIAEKNKTSNPIIYDNSIYEEIMSEEINEPKADYKSDRLFQIASRAIREELIMKYKLNHRIVFMEGDKIINIEGKDLPKYVDWPELREKY